MKNWQKYKAINYILLLFLTSCFEEYSKFEYSYPNKSSIPKNKGEYSITILYNNNFNNSLSPIKELYPGSNEISVGGQNLLKDYVQIIRQKYQNNLLIDSGNMIARKADNEEVSRTLNLYNELKFDAVLLSENEIINIPKTSSVDFPIIASNILDIKKETDTDFLKSTTYLIKEMAGIKIAFIGLTLYKEDLNISGVVFDDPVAKLISTLSQIKEEVDFKILLIHPQSRCANYQECRSQHKELEEIVGRFPPESVDLIIGGDYTEGNSSINDFPVAQNYGHGQFLGLLHLNFDQNKKILKDGINILTPIKICSHFFDATADCHLQIGDKAKEDLLKESKFKLIKPRFLGSNI